MRAVRRLGAPAAAVLGVVAGCGGKPVDLTVDVITDWSPSRDFVTVETDVSREAFSGEGTSGEVQQVTLGVTGTEPWLDGVRVADLADLGEGTFYVRVTLMSSGGRAIARRVLVVVLEESRAVQVLLTRTCRDVVCPAPAGAPELSECQGGSCVDPRCSPSTPEYCPPPECRSTSECEALLGCVGAVECRRGYCVCVEGELRDGGLDGGVDAGRDAGSDAGHDAGSGCFVDPDGTPCDDGNACTTGDACLGDACVGATRDCDDGDACTTDACSPATGCTHAARPTHSTCGAPNLRCCAGACVDVMTSNANCGGCGQACAAGRACVIYDSIPACTCAANTECGSPDGVCSTTYSYHCACVNDAGCASGLVCADRAGAINYCHY